MNEKIKIIIADDNKAICDFIKKYLEQYEDVEILGVANTDEEEEKMIEDLKPEIVITDLMRNHKYTGLDIIKKYANKNDSPEFLVVSADRKEDVIRDGLDVAGYVQKGFNFDYDLILKEVRRIKAEINRKKTK
jgi:DNA-binding NarL/FixJ family response regulator